MFQKVCALEKLNVCQLSVLPDWKLLFVSRPPCSERGSVLGFRTAEPSASESNNLVSVPLAMHPAQASTLAEVFPSAAEALPGCPQR